LGSGLEEGIEDKKVINESFVGSKNGIRLYIYRLYKQVKNMKISYHCISCKKDFNDMESASVHVKSTNHEIIEEKRGSWI